MLAYGCYSCMACQKGKLKYQLTDFPVNSVFNKLYLSRQSVPELLLCNGVNGPIQRVLLTVLSLIIFRVEFKASARLQTAS